MAATFARFAQLLTIDFPYQRRSMGPMRLYLNGIGLETYIVWNCISDLKFVRMNLRVERERIDRLQSEHQTENELTYQQLSLRSQK